MLGAVIKLEITQKEDCFVREHEIEGLGPADMRIGGLRVWIHGRQFPEARDKFDGNWLELTAYCLAPGSSVRASGPLLMVGELDLFVSEFEKILDTGIGSVRLEAVEPELGFEVKPIDSLGHFSFLVDITPQQLFQKHSVEFEVDQSELRSLARDWRRIREQYPLRG